MDAWVDENWSYANAAVDETSPEASRLQVWVLLRAGHLDAPHFLPGVIQLHVHGVDARVMRRHRVPHVSGDPMLLEDANAKLHQATYVQIQFIISIFCLQGNYSSFY